MTYRQGEIYDIRPHNRTKYRAGKETFPALCLGVRQFTKNLKAYAFQYTEGEREGREFLIPIAELKGQAND